MPYALRMKNISPMNRNRKTIRMDHGCNVIIVCGIAMDELYGAVLAQVIYIAWADSPIVPRPIKIIVKKISVLKMLPTAFCRMTDRMRKKAENRSDPKIISAMVLHCNTPNLK